MDAQSWVLIIGAITAAITTIATTIIAAWRNNQKMGVIQSEARVGVEGAKAAAQNVSEKLETASTKLAEVHDLANGNLATLRQQLSETLAELTAIKKSFAAEVEQVRVRADIRSQAMADALSARIAKLEAAIAADKKPDGWETHAAGESPTPHPSAESETHP
jgi:hypothetical protein